MKFFPAPRMPAALGVMARWECVCGGYVAHREPERDPDVEADARRDDDLLEARR